MKQYLGIDLGGTNIALGIVTEDGKITGRLSLPVQAQRPADEVLGDISKGVMMLLDNQGLSLSDLESIGIGVPGTANTKTGVLEYANNLNLDGVPLVGYLEDCFDKKVYFENDANAAAWGEYLAGAGKGCESLVMMTLGTGIGGGFIWNQMIYQGFNFAAGEIGHMVIEMDGLICTCGRRGCFEAYASATALIRMAGEAMKADPTSLLWQLSKNDPQKVDGKKIFDAVRAKDTAAIKAYQRFMKYLAEGTANIINIFQPECLLVGGGLSRSEDLLIPDLQRMTADLVYTRNSDKPTRIAAASLYNDAGIIGAALLEKQNMQ